MKPIFKITIWAAGLILSQMLFTSCPKDETPEPQENCMIKDIDLTDSTEHYLIHMLFDENDKVISYQSTMEGMQYKIDLTYNGDKIVFNIENTDGSFSQRLCELDDDGRIAYVSETDSGDEWDYSYDDEGFLVEEYFEDGENSDRDYERTYSYSNGNCTSTVTEYGDGDIQTATYFYYPDKLNKGGYFGQTKDWAFGLDLMRLLNLPIGKASENLLKTHKVVLSPGLYIKTEYEYDINEKGYVTSRISKIYVDDDLSDTYTTYVDYLCK